MESCPVAILVSDTHLSHKAPPCRAEQTTEVWYGVMLNYLVQLGAVCAWYVPGRTDTNQRDAKTPLPIIVAGDLFDRWDSPPELINFAIKFWPKTKTYAIAGQHDLPNHSLGHIQRSAYWTMVEAGVIENLKMGYTTKIAINVWVVGFPWGCDLDPRNVLRMVWGDQKPGDRIVAVVHRPVWSGHKPYPGAPDDGKLGQVLKRFAGWDVVHMGDYHKTEIWHRPKDHTDTPTVFNPGTFMVRKSDEINHAPKIGILYSDGTVKTHLLDISRDRFVSAPREAEAESVGLDARELLKELRSAADRGVDFLQAVRRIVGSKDLGPLVQKMIDKCLEDK